MIEDARLHRHRSGRARDCSRNLAPPSALRARSVFPAVWAGQRNLRSSRTRDFKSSASTVVSVGMLNNTRERSFVMSSGVETSLDISEDFFGQINPARVHGLNQRDF